MSEPRVFELTEAQPNFATSVMDASVRDAARTLFEVVGMDYDENLVNQFLATTDGRMFMLYAAKLLSFINERNIARLSQEVSRVGLKPV